MDRKIEEQFIKSLFSGNGYMQTPLEELEALRQAAEYSAAAYKEAKARFTAQKQQKKEELERAYRAYSAQAYEEYLQATEQAAQNYTKRNQQIEAWYQAEKSRMEALAD